MTERPFTFSLTFVALFACMVLFMAAVDALPESVTGSSEDSSQQVLGSASPQPDYVAQSPQTSEYPTRVVAKSIGLDATVVNPIATDVDSLDQELTKGAVRYPTSALLGQDGTVLLFGHSSYLPVVYHQYYKTFNGIQNLKKGATVSVYSQGTEYRYSVTEVRLANADEDVVELPQSGKRLVLVTCDSFATKSSRYVVLADLLGAYATAGEPR